MQSKSSAGLGRGIHPATVALIVLCAVCGSALAQEDVASPELVDRILVIVDEEAILLSEVEREVALYSLEAHNAGIALDQDPATIREDVLSRLIESKLIIAAAKQEKIEVSDEAISRDVQSNIDQLVRYYGSLAKLESELLRNGMTLNDYRRRSYSQLRDQHYMRAVVGRFIRPRIEVREDEVEDWYGEHADEIPATPDSLTLADILIAVQPSDEVQRELQGKLGAALQALGEGASFADVAREHSEDPGASRGGKLGTIRPGDLKSAMLEDVIFSLDEGETSQPVVTERGLHILRLDAVGEGGREVSQIFFPLIITEQDVARARAEADVAYARLLAGEPFAMVAGETSVDPGSTALGGDLGRFALSDLSPRIQEALAEAGAGELTEPFLTPAGFYIFLVKERTYGRSLTLVEVRDQVRQAVESEKLQEELTRYVAELRTRFVVDRKD
ncbi:peptidylprolyl isomerase [bacterium]|nr:peptidylprolyl isomerase [bacterium]MBU1073200.1 peptidylprolyl isomerase [bacterium]MBU1674435.1 peptidylprolyl isomerase [bacterium]